MRDGKQLLSNRKGLTIVELMVALVLSFILIGAVYRTFTSQQKAYTVQDQVAEAQQNARMAMNMLVRDIRMAGYGMPDTGVTINKVAYSNAIKIKKNDKYGGVVQEFDSVTIVGAFGAPSGYLNRTISPGSTEVFLRSSDEASNFDTGGRQYIFIGGIDKLTVAGVSGNKLELSGEITVRYPTGILSAGVDGGETEIPLVDTGGLASGDVLNLGAETIIITAVSNNTLTVDTDLETAGNQGISGTYPAGTVINPIPVFRITAVEYTIDPDSGCFLRDDKIMTAGGSEAARLAGNIQDIQITPDDQDDQTHYTITLTARTRNPDPDFTDNGGYRQRILQSAVMLRNLR